MYVPKPTQVIKNYFIYLFACDILHLHTKENRTDFSLKEQLFVVANQG